MEQTTNTYQEQQLHFRKTADGELITITELNTKITYVQTKEYKLGRLIIVREQIKLRKTFAARIRYVLYNNRVSRFKRAVVPSVKRFMADHGLQIYVAQ